MSAFFVIAWNSFRELLRQPVWGVVLAGMLTLIVLLANVSYFGFGEEARLVKTTALSIVLLAGLLSAVLSATISTAQEIRSGTAVTLLAKPVGRARFLLAKYCGLAVSLTVQTGAGLLTALLASRMAFDASGSPDWLALGVFVCAPLLAVRAGAASHYFFRRSFCSDAGLALVAAVAAAFVVINFFDRHGAAQPFGAGVDWRMFPAGLLVWLAVLVLCALALACATRLALLPTLLICSGLFVLGLMSDYLVGRAARGGSALAAVAHTLLPNWQLFWVADLLGGTTAVPWSYLGLSAGYALAYVVLALSLALLLFENRDLA